MPTVLVTGASTGIGRTTALALARTHTVLAGVRRLEDAPPGTTPVLLDVTDPEHVAALREIEQLDGLVNNAGVAISGPLEFLPVDELRRQFEINVFGLLAVTQAVLAPLRRARGRIVNVSSISGRVAVPLLGPYASSKFAVEALSDTLRRELGDIRVVVIEPGSVATPIWGRSVDTGLALWDAMPPAAHARYGKLVHGMQVEAKRLSREGDPPELVAQAIVKALTAARPRTRYVVGKDARIQAVLSRTLPDRVFDALVKQATRKLLNNP
jgi:NAD(P)-dependent dehydrogenase (short-subunit alcohol dehydrogenase family)